MEGIINDPKFQSKLLDIAEHLGQTYDQVYQEAKECLKELYTVHQPLSNILGLQLSQFILSRAYKKTIDVNPPEMKALTKLARRHPIAFVMTHKTYLDMFVLALTLGQHGMPFPYTFAGINMDDHISHFTQSTENHSFYFFGFYVSLQQSETSWHN